MEWQLPTPADSEQRGVVSPMGQTNALHPIAEEEEGGSAAESPQDIRRCVRMS